MKDNKTQNIDVDDQLLIGVLVWILGAPIIQLPVILYQASPK